MRAVLARRASPKPPSAALPSLDFESHGVVIRIVADDDRMLELVRAELPPCSRPADGGTPDVRYRWATSGRAGKEPLHVVSVDCPIEVGADDIARETDPTDAADLLCRDAEFRVAMHSRHGVFVHAAAVGWAGRAILLPGYSRAGKSTLTAALVAAGATYYSDEYAVLDERGLLHPFARRLRLRNPGRTATRVTAEGLGGTTGSEPLPVGLIISTGYEAGAVWTPNRASAGQAALALLDNTVVARLRPDLALRHTARAAAHAVSVTGPRGDAADTARRVLAFATELFAA